MVMNFEDVKVGQDFRHLRIVYKKVEATEKVNAVKAYDSKGVWFGRAEKVCSK